MAKKKKSQQEEISLETMREHYQSIAQMFLMDPCITLAIQSSSGEYSLERKTYTNWILAIDTRKIESESDIVKLMSEVCIKIILSELDWADKESVKEKAYKKIMSGFSSIIDSVNLGETDE